MTEEIEEGGPPCEQCGGFTEPLTAGTIVQIKKVVNDVENTFPYELPYDVFRCPLDGWETLQNPLEREEPHFFLEASQKQKEIAAKVMPVCVMQGCYVRAPKPEIRQHMIDDHGVVFPSQMRLRDSELPKNLNEEISEKKSSTEIGIGEALGIVRDRIFQGIPKISININSKEDAE